MFREPLQRYRESLEAITRRVAAALRIIPRHRLTLIGAAGGVITANIAGAIISVRRGEERTVLVPRGTPVAVEAAPERRWRFVSLIINGEEVGERIYAFRIMADTTVTARFAPRFWRVQALWELVVPERFARRRTPRVAAEARIYTYVMADNADEAEEALENIDELFEALQDPATCIPPDSAVHSFALAEETMRGFIDRTPPYGVEVAEVDPDEVEEPDTIFAYMATYRGGRIRHSYKWRWDDARRAWMLIERDGRPI